MNMTSVKKATKSSGCVDNNTLPQTPELPVM